MQKKLQMRIEAQGKYLQAILEKAQKSLSVDVYTPSNVEATRAELSQFNLALSNFIENVNGQESNANVVDNSSNISASKSNSNNLKLKLKEVEGGSICFDLNTRSSYI